MIHHRSGCLRQAAQNGAADAGIGPGAQAYSGTREAVLNELQILTSPDLFRLAVERGWVLTELTPKRATLEDVFLSLTTGEAAP